MLIQSALIKNAGVQPEKSALVFGENRYSYGDVDVLTDRVARRLKTLGLKRGERVLIYLDNRPEVIFSVYGILKADGIFVVINPDTKLEKLVYILNNCEASMVISSAKFLNEESMQTVRKECRSVRNFIDADDGETYGYECLLSNHDGEKNNVFAENISIDIAGIIYTSGSTGTPKGVTMSHLNIMTAVNSISTYLRNTSDDIIIDMLPLSFDYGLYQVFMCFTFGGTLVLLSNLAYFYTVIETIQREKVTGFPLVPTILSLLFKLKNPGALDLSSVRYISNTGAAIPVHYIKKFRELFPDIQIYSMYGLTECKRVAYLEPEEIDTRPSSVGKAMPDLEAFIVDDEGNRLGPGNTGMLVVRGASVMQGYWNDPESTSEKIKPGRYPLERFLITGDIFRMDDEGYLYFIGRKDDLLKIKGERVAPREVENILLRFPDVVEATVIGVPDEMFGTALKAYIVCSDSQNGVDVDEVKLFCSRYLESYAVPRQIIMTDNLPRNANGKIEKSKII